mgnify:CR=1 FL=1
MFEAAYFCEIMRAGIQSIPRGQVWAGYALGLNYWLTMGKIVLPQAFRIVLPPLTSEFMNVIKNSSVALTIGLLELTGRARAMQEFSFRVFEAFATATLIYLVVNVAYYAVLAPDEIHGTRRVAALAIEHGTPTLWQNTPVFVVILAGGFTTNFLWCVTLNWRNRTSRGTSAAKR